MRQPKDVPSTFSIGDVSTKRVFLAKLFVLLAVMAECSKEFIASRFLNDVFPLLGQLLGSFATSSDLGVGPEYFKDSQTSKSRGRQPSETLLIISMLKCLFTLFDERVCGHRLAELVPSVGTMILPFLGDDHIETRDACDSAIRQMLRIDCDALWRPLVHLSGGTVASAKPWEVQGRIKLEVTALSSKVKSPLESRALELVLFTESLSEQPLL